MAAERPAFLLLAALTASVAPGCSVPALEPVDPLAEEVAAVDQGQADTAPVRVPDGVQLEQDHLFSMDSTTAVFERSLPGPRGHAILGVLHDEHGRREIRYRGPDSTSEERVAPPGWLLPATGAVADDGSVFVCWGRLTGRDSSLTAGAVPDPTQGVACFCRLRSAGSWGPIFKAGGTSVATWVQTVEPTRDGFKVTTWADGGWLVIPTSQADGVYEQDFDGMGFSDPVLVRAVRPEELARSGGLPDGG